MLHRTTTDPHSVLRDLDLIKQKMPTNLYPSFFREAVYFDDYGRKKRCIELGQLRRFAKTCRKVVIVAGNPSIEQYAAAANEAAIGRRNVLIIETSPAKAEAWASFMRRIDSKLSIGSSAVFALPPAACDQT